MKDPAFLFYSSDFLNGISDLTMEERGQYITLLCLQHQKGHLTEKMISLCCGNATADVLAKFRQDDSGNYYNERLEIEIGKRKEFSEKQREKAINGWKKRKNEYNGNANADATAYATAMPIYINENVNENENENINEIPTFETFETFLKSKYENFEPYRENWKLKYESWIENKWKDGNNNKIKNWKTKVLNTMPYIKEKQSTLGVKHLSQKHNLF